MPNLTVLHLSDAHWSEAKDEAEKVMVDRLIDDLETMKGRSVCPDIIIFSGDLVQAGEDSQSFESASKVLLEPVLRATGLASDRLFVCPGNHDISRQTAREQALLEEGLKARLVSEEALNEFIKKAHDGSKMELMALDRLANFYNWHDAAFEGFTSAGPFGRIKTLTIAGKKIGVALLNTAWRATGEPGSVDEGHLILGSIFAEKAAEHLKDCDYKIAVQHHPFEALAEFDRDKSENRISKGFDLICTGHTHKPRPERVEDIFGSSIRSQAGSLYAGSRWYNGYQIVSVDFIQDKTRVFCREYFSIPDKFDKASNLTDADPVEFDYAVKVKNGDDQIELFLNANRSAVRDRLLDHLNFSNSDDLSDEALLAGFACPKLFKKSDSNVDESGNLSSSFLKVNIDNVLSGGDDVLFYGPRQTGKTCLKFYIAHRYAYGIGCAPKIPVIIDAKSFKYNLYALKRAISSVYDVPAKFEVESAVENGSFVFLFEDVGQLSEDELKQLHSFIANCAPNRSFVFGCPDQNSLAKERHFKRILTSLTPIGLGELTRGTIRRMTESWFTDSDEAKAKFDLVVGQLNRDGLPRTAYMVGLLLWAAKQGQKGDRLNEAILLQNVLDHLLDRANFRSAKRGALTTRGKELLLSRIANCLDQCGDLARSVDVISWVDEYFQKKKLGHDASEVVSELVNCGILIREDAQIGFRYKCFQEYYIALGMLDPAERESKLGGPKFLGRAREVELLSGLQGENDWLIQNIVGVLKERSPKDLLSVEYADFEKLAYGAGDLFLTREKIRKIRRTRLTEEQLDQVMDAIDERATARGDRPISESLEEADGDIVRVAYARQADAVRRDLEEDVESFRPSTYMAGLSILARVVRNSDYTDYDVKGPALFGLLDEWCRIHVLISRDARWVLERIEELEDDPLDKSEFETVVHMVSKLLFGAIGGGLVSELATPALVESLHELEREGKLITGRRLLSLFLLEDADDPAWPDKWKDVIEDKKTASFDIDVLMDRLWRSVNRKALDDEQDRRVIKVVDATDRRFDWGNEQKSSVLEHIRELTNVKKATED